MGTFGCGQKKLKSDLDKFGVGSISYFKTLKSLLIALGLIVLLNIIIYLIYGLTHLDQNSDSLNGALFKNTIGNVASSKLNFSYLT